VLDVAASYGKPLWVTENGIADADDSKRPSYIVNHVAVVQDLVAHDVDIVVTAVEASEPSELGSSHAAHQGREREQNGKEHPVEDAKGAIGETGLRIKGELEMLVVPCRRTIFRALHSIARHAVRTNNPILPHRISHIGPIRVVTDKRQPFEQSRVALGSDLLFNSIHRFKQSRAEMTARIVRALGNPWVNVLVHPTGRLIGSRDPYDVDLEAVFAAARAHGKAVEINSSPERMDLSDVNARRAGALGVPIAVSTDTHSLRELDNLELGIGIARRAWLQADQVLNTRPLEDLLAWARPGR